MFQNGDTVTFPLEALTGREKTHQIWEMKKDQDHCTSMGGDSYSNLQLCHITHTLKESEHWKRNNGQFIPSDECGIFQAMLLDPEYSALPMGSLVAPPLHEKGTTSVRQNISIHPVVWLNLPTDLHRSTLIYTGLHRSTTLWKEFFMPWISQLQWLLCFIQLIMVFSSWNG